MGSSSWPAAERQLEIEYETKRLIQARDLISHCRAPTTSDPVGRYCAQLIAPGVAHVSEPAVAGAQLNMAP
jgi:hypothetical protein